MISLFLLSLLFIFFLKHSVEITRTCCLSSLFLMKEGENIIGISALVLIITILNKVCYMDYLMLVTYIIALINMG